MGSLIRVVPASRERPRLTPARAATALSLPCHPTWRDCSLFSGPLLQAASDQPRAISSRRVSVDPSPIAQPMRSPYPVDAGVAALISVRPAFGNDRTRLPFAANACSVRVRPKSIIGNCSAFAASA
jgi:hypothetical protein